MEMRMRSRGIGQYMPLRRRRQLRHGRPPGPVAVLQKWLLACGSVLAAVCSRVGVCVLACVQWCVHEGMKLLCALCDKWKEIHANETSDAQLKDNAILAAFARLDRANASLARICRTILDILRSRTFGRRRVTSQASTSATGRGNYQNYDVHSSTPETSPDESQGSEELPFAIWAEWPLSDNQLRMPDVHPSVNGNHSPVSLAPFSGRGDWMVTETPLRSSPDYDDDQTGAAGVGPDRRQEQDGGGEADAALAASRSDPASSVPDVQPNVNVINIHVSLAPFSGRGDRMETETPLRSSAGDEQTGAAGVEPERQQDGGGEANVALAASRNDPASSDQLMFLARTMERQCEALGTRLASIEEQLANRGLRQGPQTIHGRPDGRSSSAGDTPGSVISHQYNVTMPAVEQRRIYNISKHPEIKSVTHKVYNPRKRIDIALSKEDEITYGKDRSGPNSGHVIIDGGTSKIIDKRILSERLIPLISKDIGVKHSESFSEYVSLQEGSDGGDPEDMLVPSFEEKGREEPSPENIGDAKQAQCSQVLVAAVPSMMALSAVANQVSHQDSSTVQDSMDDGADLESPLIEVQDTDDGIGLSSNPNILAGMTSGKKQLDTDSKQAKPSQLRSKQQYGTADSTALALPYQLPTVMNEQGDLAAGGESADEQLTLPVHKPPGQVLTAEYCGALMRQYRHSRSADDSMESSDRMTVTRVSRTQPVDLARCIDCQSGKSSASSEEAQYPDPDQWGRFDNPDQTPSQLQAEMVQRRRRQRLPLATSANYYRGVIKKHCYAYSLALNALEVVARLQERTGIPPHIAQEVVHDRRTAFQKAEYLIMEYLLSCPDTVLCWVVEELLPNDTRCCARMSEGNKRVQRAVCRTLWECHGLDCHREPGLHGLPLKTMQSALMADDAEVGANCQDMTSASRLEPQPQTAAAIISMSSTTQSSTASVTADTQRAPVASCPCPLLVAPVTPQNDTSVSVTGEDHLGSANNSLDEEQQCAAVGSSHTYQAQLSYHMSDHTGDHDDVVDEVLLVMANPQLEPPITITISSDDDVITAGSPVLNEASTVDMAQAHETPSVIAVAEVATAGAASHTVVDSNMHDPHAYNPVLHEEDNGFADDDDSEAESDVAAHPRASSGASLSLALPPESMADGATADASGAASAATAARSVTGTSRNDIADVSDAVNVSPASGNGLTATSCSAGGNGAEVTCCAAPCQGSDLQGGAGMETSATTLACTEHAPDLATGTCGASKKGNTDNRIGFASDRNAHASPFFPHEDMSLGSYHEAEAMEALPSQLHHQSDSGAISEEEDCCYDDAAQPIDLSLQEVHQPGSGCHGPDVAAQTIMQPALEADASPCVAIISTDTDGACATPFSALTVMEVDGDLESCPDDSESGDED